MPTACRLSLRPTRSSLASLPPSLYTQLLQRQARPQALAVHVRSHDGSERYIGWSGLSSARPATPGQAETLELDPGVAASFGWADGELVEVSLTPHLPPCQALTVSPLTAEDWDVISHHAGWLEDNLLLSLRCAAKGQVVEVWVKGRTRVRMRVDAVAPDKPAVLLRHDSEVHVAPFVRPPASLPSSTPSAAPSASAPAAGAAPSALSDSPADGQRPIETGPQPPSAAAGPPARAPTSVEPPATAAAEPEVPEPYLGFQRGHELARKLRTAAAAAAADGKSERAERQLPGLEAYVQDAFGACMRSYVLQSGVVFPSGLSQGRTVLVTGGPRSGKTAVVRAVCARLEEDTRVLAWSKHVDCPKLADERLPQLRETLAAAVAEVNRHRPAVLVLDGLDALAGVEMPNADPTRPRLIAELLLTLLAPSSRAFAPGTTVVCTARSSADLHPSLAGAHAFAHAVALRALAKAERAAVLRALVEAKVQASAGALAVRSGEGEGDGEGGGEGERRGVEVSVQRTAMETEGFAIGDLKDLVDRAVGEAAIRCAGEAAEAAAAAAAAAGREGGGGQTAAPARTTLLPSDFARALSTFTPFALRALSLPAPAAAGAAAGGWADIGGLDEVKRTLRETLEWPVRYGPVFRQSPLRLRSGLLLYGYPGCGKTLLAAAVAKECGLNFIGVKGPEILNKYIGASEKSVRDLFDRAAAAKPCVLFFDEFDSIAPKRGHDSTGVTDRVVNQMLTQMDGAEGLDGVYVLAATSRPDLIDPALLRPGRLDKSLLCPMPSESDRLSILQALTRTLRLAPTVDLAAVAARAEHFTGADLGGLVGSAQLAAVHAAIDEGAAAAAAASASAAEAPGSEGAKGVREAGEVLVLGGGGGGGGARKGAGKGRSRAEEDALRARVGRMVGVGRKDLGLGARGSSASTSSSPPTLHQPQLLAALAAARPSVPPAERGRLGAIYAAFAGVDARGAAFEGGEGSGTGVGSRSSLG